MGHQANVKSNSVLGVKKLFKFALWVLFLGALITWLNREPIYTPTALMSPRSNSFFPSLIAHKSILSGQFLGNTKPALDESLKSAIQGIELDVRQSKDGVLFLYHADTLDESTTGRGKPEDYTFDELSKLSYKDNPNHKILSLQEVFQLVGSRKTMFLDIKSNHIYDKAFAQRLSTLIRQFNLRESVILESFNPIFLCTMRWIDRDILLMYDFTTDKTAQGEEIQSQFDRIPWLLTLPFVQKQIRRWVHPDILGPRFNVDPKLIESFKTAQYPIIAWTVDDPKVAQNLLDLGVNGIQTNKALDLLKTLKIHQNDVMDMGGTHARPHTIIHVTSEKNVLDAIATAKKQKRPLTIAGRRHSMGGQTLLNGALLLNMLPYNRIFYDPQTKILKAQAGAIWKDIQNLLDQNGRSVKVMQSDNIFTVGGSLSVNVHGWQVGAPPLSSTVKSLKVATAEGQILTLTAHGSPELFKAVLGGYGLLAVILEVELETVANTTVKFQTKFGPMEDFEKTFNMHVRDNPKAELAYGRVSVDQENLLKEFGLFWFETETSNSPDRIQDEKWIPLKREVFRFSQYSDVGKKLRWTAEKFYAKHLLSARPLSRNNAMNADIHVLWPIYQTSTDILHEYFIPIDQLDSFLQAFRKLVLDNHINLLNMTLREVRQDKITLMPYAQKDVIALVCFYAQEKGAAAEKEMIKFTQQTIDTAFKHGGSFYLPYRLHYTKEQFLKAYPHAPEFMALKKKWDPQTIFTSEFFNYWRH